MNLTGFKSSASSEGSLKIPLWTNGDTNAFFGLGFNILVNVLTLTSLLIFVVQIPATDVLGTVLPALGIAMLAGNIYYTFLARRLARRENRTDVTALPYGPSVPHMFIVVFVIMLPIFLTTGDPVRAWEAGLAWAFVIGVIVLIGAFVGPFIRKITPRAAMLGTLAGISLTFISMRPAAPDLGGGLDRAAGARHHPGRLLHQHPAARRHPGRPGRAAGRHRDRLDRRLHVGAGRAGGGRARSPSRVPTLHFDMLFNGLSNLAPLLATAIPLGVYNFAEAMSNVESAAAAGDSYNLRSVLLADGSGAIIGAALGSPFPPAVYIGHPGWKAAGGRGSYSMASGIFIAVLCFLGLFGVLNTVLPIPAIVPILLYIGLLIGAQAFQSVPKIQAAAVVAAILPNLASWGTGLIDNALAAAGTTAAEVGDEALGNAGLVYDGLKILGEGAVLAGMVLGSIVAFILMHKFYAVGDRRRGRRRAQLDRADPRQRGRLGRAARGGARLRDARNRAGGLRLLPAERARPGRERWRLPRSLTCPSVTVERRAHIRLGRRSTGRLGRLDGVPPIRHPLSDPTHPGRRRRPDRGAGRRCGREQVVLVDDDGAADRRRGQGHRARRRTPRVISRSPATASTPTAGCWSPSGPSSKPTFPLVWTNTCCGHPAPGEDLADAADPPAAVELGLQVQDMRMVLPDFSYRASDGRVEENEFCPVLVCRIDGEPTPRAGRGGDHAWWSWAQFLAAADAADSGLSPWARQQAPLLDAALFGGR